VAETIAPVELASEPDFEIGALSLSPSSCRVSSGGQEQHAEPRVMQVLVILARRPGQTVTRDQLIESCWGGRVVSDDAVNRVLAQVRAVARGFEPPPFALETVPKVGFRLVVKEAGAEIPVNASPAPAPASAERMWLRPNPWAVAAAASLAALLGAVLFWGQQSGSAPLGARQNGRIEVVRFENRQGDAALQGFAGDLGDSLIRNLTRSSIDTVPQTIPRGDGSSPAGAELRVAGSVERQGETVVADVQILDRETGLALTFVQLTRPAKDLAGFANEAGLDIAGVLSCALEDRKRSAKPMDPAVLALYLNTCDAFVREGNVQRALETSQRLVAAAPRLAIAQAMYAIMQAHAFRESDRSPAEIAALTKGARETALLALKLNPDTPKAYVALALSYPDDSNWLEREQALVKARATDPNLGPGRVSYVNLLRRVGRLRDAAKLANQLVDSVDPRIAGAGQRSLAFVFSQSGDVAAAKEMVRQMETLDPGSAFGAKWILASYWEPPDEALADLKNMPATGIDPRSYVCVQKYLAELPGRLAAKARGLPQECEHVSAVRRAVMLIREGDVDGAYGLVDSSKAVDAEFLGFLYGPATKAFWRDPRFMAFADRFGLVDYWMNSGHWPDFCTDPGAPYDCQAVAASVRATAKRAP